MGASTLAAPSLLPLGTGTRVTLDSSAGEPRLPDVGCSLCNESISTLMAYSGGIPIGPPPQADNTPFLAVGQPFPQPSALRNALLFHVHLGDEPGGQPTSQSGQPSLPLGLTGHQLEDAGELQTATSRGSIRWSNGA